MILFSCVAIIIFKILEAVVQSCSMKKVFLEVPQKSIHIY